MRNSKDFILGFMSKVAAGLLAVFLMLPTVANAIDTNLKGDEFEDLIGGGDIDIGVGDDLIIGGTNQQDCANCYRCVSFNSVTGCTQCVYDANYCYIEELYCPEACTYFKSLYSTVVRGWSCSEGSVPSGKYDTFINTACSGDSTCRSCLQNKSTRYFSAICDSAYLVKDSMITTDRINAAIELAGIENCSGIDIEDGDWGEIEIGSGEPLPPDQCQELLDWCNTDGNWAIAEGKCIELGFTGETFDNCVTLCQDMMDYPLETAIQFGASEGVCLACGGGEYYDAASESCTACAAGTAQSASIGRHIRTSCTKCSAGTYSMIGASQCTNCSAGWTSTAGSGLCIKCTKGTYAPTAGSPECLVCPDGTYSDTLAASSCTSCPADENGLTPHSLHTILQDGLLEPEYGQDYYRDSINSCYTPNNTPMYDAVGTYEWNSNCFYGAF